MLFKVLYWNDVVGRWQDLLGVALTADEVAMNLPQFILAIGGVMIVEA